MADAARALGRWRNAAVGHPRCRGWRRAAALGALAAVVMGLPTLHAEEAGLRVPHSAATAPWVPLPPGGEARYDFLVFAGTSVRNNFGEIWYRQQDEYLDSHVFVVAVSAKLGPFLGPLTFESEAQLARHIGIQDHWEANFLGLMRLEGNWRRQFSFSTALGHGVSIASAKPVLERQENPDTNTFLGALVAEIDLGLPGRAGHPRVMMRIHHRSGVFGLYCPRTCGENAITYGFKMAY